MRANFAQMDFTGPLEMLHLPVINSKISASETFARHDSRLLRQESCFSREELHLTRNEI